MFNTETNLSEASQKILDNNNPAWTTCEPPNNGIKTINLSRRVRVYKNNVSIDADISENGMITVINTKQHHLENDKHVFKFINSKPGTVKAIAELFLAVSEVK